MFSVRVPFGTKSGRASFAGVFGNAPRAPLTRPPPFTPNLPASAGSANAARTPLPPFWLRSSPLPTAIAAGEIVRNHSANCWTSRSSSPHSPAAAASVHGRASAMYSSYPATWRSTNARSIPPRRSSSAAIAHASTTSVPGFTARCRSARSAIFVRFVPRDSLEAAFALRTGAPQRRREPAGSVHELRVRLRDLRAEHTGRVRVRARPADLRDASGLDGDGEAAGIGTIEGAHARALDGRCGHRVGV